MNGFDGLDSEQGNLKLVLFFTRNISLCLWDESGMFEREVALYRQLIRRGVTISFVTYGDSLDLRYANLLPGVRILCNRWGFKSGRYVRWLPWLHWRDLRSADVYKTNQTNGAEVALAAARCWRKPLVARCGYLWSEFAAEQYGAESSDAHRATRTEETVFRAAQRVVVTTPDMAHDISLRMADVSDRVRIIPNYVETDRFVPQSDRYREIDLIFVGRLHPQKNVAALLEAIAPLNVSLRIVGAGAWGDELRSRFSSLGGRVQWLPRVANLDLPGQMTSARAFVLPSHYEGHPKVLLEAMACGLPVIGADSPGIREIIAHGQNGWLCGTEPESIRSAIVRVLGDAALQAALGTRARRYAEEQVAIERIVDLELQVLREAVAA